MNNVYIIKIYFEASQTTNLSLPTVLLDQVDDATDFVAHMRA